LNANHGRTDLFRTFLKGRVAVWTNVLGGSAVFLYGAYRRDPLVMAGGPVAVAAAVAIIAFVMADRAAARRFFSEFAKSVGLSYTPKTGILPLTPLLGAGERQWVEHWMEGELAGGHSGGVGQLVWERRARDSSGNERLRERRRQSLCVVDLEPSIALFRGVYLHPRRGGSGWLDRGGTRTVELESSAFNECYELRIEEAQDEIVLRRLLAPTLVSWLANHPLSPGVELRAGALTVFVDHVIDDAGNLVFLMDAASHLATAVMRELDESARRAA
jgi:hypothetical protein